ncbi:MAG: PAS-domain containing protein, partial [Rhodopila sp.]
MAVGRASTAPLRRLVVIGIMKPDKHLVGALGIILTAIGLIALTWVGTMRAIHVQRQENLTRVNAILTNQALTLTEQVNRQLLALDQTLRMLVTAWETNPGAFDLEVLRSQAVVLNGISRDMILTDEAGIIRQSSVVPAINLDVSATDFFRDLADPYRSGDRMFVGPASIGAIMRQWHMDVARALHHQDGSFAGVISADYRIAAMTDIFRQTDLGAGGFVTLVGLEDGKMRGTIGPAAVDPDVSIADTRMFAAIQRNDSGLWTGPTAGDLAVRIHAYRRIPDQPLVLVVAMNEQEAMRPATTWRQQAQLFAGCITALLISLAGLLLHITRHARRRGQAMAKDRAVLAASNARLEVTRALETAKAERLEATLAGMSDGVSMFDGTLCLIEWNARFPEIAGIPPEILRIGLPMEEVLRAQIASGQFGQVTDPEGEIERRIARMRAGLFGVVQRQTPDGRTLEVRCNGLPDGGFVVLYADVTAHRQTGEALRQARAEAEAANAAKSRFVAFLSHEIRTALNTLLNALQLLSDSTLPPPQQSVLALARQSGDVLFGLVNDTLEMSQMEAGKLVIRPGLFDLRSLLDGIVDLSAPQAADRGIILRTAIAEGTPPTLVADSQRLRQVLLNLISNALTYARPGEVWLTAEPGPTEAQAVLLTVRDGGPVIDPSAREALFRPFSRLDRLDDGNLPGTGLGLAICRHLVSLMAGDIGCRPWTSAKGQAGGQAGNAFWLTLPATALPFREVTDAALRTQVLRAIRATDAASDAEFSPAPANEAGRDPIGANIAGHSAVIPAASWPGLARPSTTGGADRGKDVDGRAKHVLGRTVGPGRGPGHDTGATGPAMLAPIRCDPAEVLADAQRRPIPRTRILLADDIRANQLVTATLLRRAGHSVDVVANGEAAVEAVRTVPYDLILMDVFMPGMDGPEIATIIRSLPAPACAIPILALT